MRFDLFAARAALMSAVLSFAGLLGACGGPRDAAQQHRSQEARLTRLLDDRRYADVIRILEGDEAGSREFALLLAMAHLGSSGFEPLRFASRVVGAQPAESPALDRVLPGCETRAIERFEQLPTRCLIKRIWAHAPDADDTGLAVARGMLRSLYPEPSSTPAEYNTLIATIEAASALSRMRKILSTAEDARDDLLPELAMAAEEADQALSRAKHSVKAVSKLLTGLDYKSLFAMDPAGRLAWVEDTGVPALLRATGASDALGSAAGKVERAARDAARQLGAN